MSWCTIESDPGVFSKLIDSFGVEDVQVEEVLGLDDESFARLRPVYGLVFLFKWQERPTAPATVDAMGSDVFFASQTINNACGTLALLHILLNHKDITIGDKLGSYKEFAGFMDPYMRGETLRGHDAIRIAHNSFARPEPFVQEKATSADDAEDAFHFISYVPVGNKVYELDGLSKGPVLVGEVTEGEDWISIARPAIYKRMEEHASSEIRFVLMSVVKSLQKKALEAKAEAESKLEIADNMIAAADDGGEEVAAMKEAMVAQRDEAKDTIAESEAIIESEKDKFQRYATENIRRRHNYVPLIMEILREMAKADKLKPAHERGAKKYKEARARAKAEAAKEGGGGGSA